MTVYMQQHQSSARPYLPILLILFAGSGCAALIYEIVWFQLLQLAIGSSAVSLGALLGTFMGGMCLGSILLPKKISTRHHPLRVYAYLELGIGVLGLLVLWAIPVLDRVYAAVASIGLQGVFLRAVVAAMCLLPPTLLMGASLPAIARWIETTPQGISWLGFFYGGNIAGAVFGCLLAGFYLLRVYDMAFTTYTAVFINAAVGGLALLLARSAEYKPSRRRSDVGTGASGRRQDRLPRHRDLRNVRAGRRSRLDPAAGDHDGRHGVHVLGDSRGVPGRIGDRQQRRSIAGAIRRSGRASRWDCASFWRPRASAGPPTCWPIRFPIGR